MTDNILLCTNTGTVKFDLVFKHGIEINRLLNLRGIKYEQVLDMCFVYINNKVDLDYFIEILKMSSKNDVMGELGGEDGEIWMPHEEIIENIYKAFSKKVGQ